ncbi:MAG: exopolysaccharide biosynthesis polyprenyl glycosylphosphotransferase [Gemmatimonadales bacterium]|nr:exopolysaccharide biosynthesis polyprenyl glycosylphosphotransferase [Gemmatimonadales bacterium]
MKEDAVALAVVENGCLISPHKLFIPADTSRYYGNQAFLKRALDVVMASVMLLVACPMMLVIALLVKRSSPGPVLFIQDRLGRDGKPFRFYKFRSMQNDSNDAIHRQFAAMFINGDESGCKKSNAGDTVFKMKTDPRVTGIGAWLRKTSMDELPQLFNILRGDMSLVGPRPPIDYEIENYQPWHMERLKAVPGLTGLWQVSGRSSVSFEEMVRLDVNYINNWSLWWDFAIILRTVPVVLWGTGGH